MLKVNHLVVPYVFLKNLCIYVDVVVPTPVLSR